MISLLQRTSLLVIPSNSQGVAAFMPKNLQPRPPQTIKAGRGSVVSLRLKTDDAERGQNRKLPLVSVMLLTYERPLLLRHALRQLARSTQERLEVVVWDDSPSAGPQDAEELRSYLRPEDQTLVYRYSRERLTIGNKRNLCVETCTAPYVIQVDDDDLYSVDRIPYQVEPLIRGTAQLTALRQNAWVVLDERNDRPRFFRATEEFQKLPHYGTMAFAKEIYPAVRYPSESSLGEDEAFFERAGAVRTQLLDNCDDHHVYVRHARATNVGHNLLRDSRFRALDDPPLEMMIALRDVAQNMPSCEPDETSLRL
uniref:Glycosyltransferase 2-like domain-containing protein n=1 Tax=Corethron hystrix TaxID=216773 RepID=A0A7S1BUI7_9STRA